MPFEIIRDDITNLKTDIIVNSSNSKLQASAGVCGAIFEKAGRDKLQKACDKLSPIETTEVVITKGYNLDCKYIIHTLAPVWKGGTENEDEKLLKTYMNCLNLAKKKKAKSIAFPLLSSGKFGYPKSKALEIATTAIKNFLSDNDMYIYIVVFDKTSFLISESLFKSVKQYIDDTYVDKSPFSRRRNIPYECNSIPNFEDDFLPEFEDDFLPDFEDEILSELKLEKLSDVQDFKPITENKILAPKPILKKAKFKKSESKKSSMSLDDILKNMDETFSETLFKYIDSSGKTDAQIYRKANIDRRLFSKIRSNKNYTPSKNTILSLAIALELPLNETKKLLEKAGYALSHSNKFDVIVEYFIINENYDIHEINETLFSFDQNTLRV